MAHLILPRRFQQQPAYPVEIDWGNPISGALAHAILPYGNTLKDYVGKSEFVTSGSPSVVPSHDGLVFKTVAGSSQYGYFPSSVTSGPLTIVIRHKINSSAIGAHVSLGTTAGTERLVLFYGAVAGSYSASAINNTNPGSPTITAGTGVFTTAGISAYAYGPTQVFADGKFAQSTEIWTPTGAVNRLYVSCRVSSTAGVFASQEVSEILVFKRALSSAEIVSLTSQPWQLFKSKKPILYFDVGSGGGSTTSNTTPGALTLTGNASAGTRSLISAATSGALTLTGSASAGAKGAVSLASSGALTLTGTASSGIRSLISAATPGALTLTGLASTGTYTPVNATTSNADPGSLTLTGSASAGIRSLISATSPGSVTLTGLASTGTYTPVNATTSNADPGQIVLTGIAATGLRGLVSLTAPGQIVLTGLASTGTYTPAGATTSNASPGALTLTGTASTGVRALRSTASVGAFTLTGFASSTQKAIQSNAAPGQVNLTGQATGALRTWISAALPASWTVTGFAATGSSVTVQTDSEKIDLILDLLQNRQELNPTTGTFTVYADDGVTVLKTALAWEDAAGTIPYSGKTLRRIDALT